MIDLSKFDGSEIYLITGSEDESVAELYIEEDFESLKEKLKEFNPCIDGQTRVFHGVLCSAEYLPASLAGKTAFIVVAEDDGRGSVFESSCTETTELAGELENLISDGGSPFSIETLSIDDVFILYGYQMKTCITVADESVDEEIIDACRQIGEKVEETKDTIRFMEA